MSALRLDWLCDAIRRDSLVVAHRTRPGRFTRSEVNNNEISGTLPPYYANWTHLNIFDAHNNSLQGPIPSSYCFSDLVVFSVFDNSLTGSVPQCVLAMPSLAYLLLSTNQLTGALHSPSAPHLSYLIAHKNRFSGPLPDLSQASWLVAVTLHDNDFMGNIDRLKISAPLEVLTLGNNKLTGDLTALESFQFQGHESCPPICNTCANSPFCTECCSIYGWCGDGPEFCEPNGADCHACANHQAGTGGLTFLSLNDNDFTGRLGDLPVSPNATVMLQNNRLSCSLPPQPPNATIDTSLTLQGNLFDGPPPSWVQSVVHFLYADTRWQYSEWFHLVVLCCAYSFVLGGVVLMMRHQAIRRFLSLSRATQQTTEEPAQDPVSSDQDQPLLDTTEEERFDGYTEQLMSLSRFSSRALACIGLVAVASLLPSSALGSNYFECGEPVIRWLTITYLSGSSTIEWISAVGVCVVGALLALFLGEFIHRARGLSTRQRARTISDQIEQKTLIQHCAVTILTRTSVVLAWACSVVLLNSPTLLYLATYSLPEENRIIVPAFAVSTCLGVVSFGVFAGLLRFAIKGFTSIERVTSIQQGDEEHDRDTPVSQRSRLVLLARPLACIGAIGIVVAFAFLVATDTIPRLAFRVPAVVTSALASAVPIIISIVNSSVIPAVTKPASKRLTLRDSRELRSAMILLARFANTIVIPVIALVASNDSCFAQWHDFWSLCDTDEFDADVLVSYSTYSGSPYGKVTTVEINLMRTSEICSSGDIDIGRCAQGVMWVLLPLFLSKALFSAFVQPAILILCAKCFTQTRDWPRLHALLGMSLGVEEIKRTLLDRTVPSEGDDEADGTVVVEDGVVVNVLLDEECLTLLTWLELAVIAGPFCPLLVLLIALSLFTNQWAYGQALRILSASARAPAEAEGNAPFAPYLVLSMAIMIVAACVLFVRERIAGATLVSGLLPTLSAMAILRGWRDPLRPRWRSAVEWCRTLRAGGGRADEQAVAQAREDAQASEGDMRSSSGLSEETEGAVRMTERRPTMTERWTEVMIAYFRRYHRDTNG